MSAYDPTFKAGDCFKVEHNYTGTTWQDFTSDLVSAQVILREFAGLHTATLVFYNAVMDPAESDGDQVIDKGDTVRISAKNPSGTFRKMGTFTVKKVTTEIDLAQPEGKQYKVTAVLHGKGITGVGGAA